MSDLTREILHATAADMLAAGAAEECDAQLCDPPFSAHVHRKATSNGTDGAGVRARDLGFRSIMPADRSVIAAAAQRVKRWTVVFTDFEGIHCWREAFIDANAEYIRSTSWTRWSQPQLSGDRPPSGSEVVISAHRAKANGDPIAKRWSGPGNLTSYRELALRGADKYSCEKPLDIMLSIVAYFSEPGETVLDMMCGAGTTGQAARILGRGYILSDSKTEAYDRSVKRLAEPLSDRDRERTERWIEAQTTNLATIKIAPSGRARHDRAMRDLEIAREYLRTR